MASPLAVRCPSGGLLGVLLAGGSSLRSRAETEKRSDFLDPMLRPPPLAVIRSSEAEAEVPLGELILGLPGGESTSSSTDELLECEREREWERERERDRERECREWCDSASSMSICEEQGLRDLDLERDRDWRRSFSLALMKAGLERWGRCGCCCCVVVAGAAGASAGFCLASRVSCCCPPGKLAASGQRPPPPSP